MIVARIVDKDGKPLAASGSVKIANYDGVNDGWFPIESFGFGLHKPEEKKDANAKGTPQTSSKSSSNTASTSTGGGKGGKGGAECTISKLVDTATPSLMILVMREKSLRKGLGDKSTPLYADIHTLSSGTISSETNDSLLYATMLIHLEAINVEGWDINASGDSRPTETVKLRYDRAAMVYVTTPDGEHFQSIGPSGWDQTADKDFEWKAPKMKKYLAPGCNCPGW